MTEDARTDAFCDVRAEELARRYERVEAASVHGHLVGLLPCREDSHALDVGAGSGRDAAWLVALGHEVVAVEPAAGMRSTARRLHPDPRIRWLDDRLPDLAVVHRFGPVFDLVLLSAVWGHVRPTASARAFRKVATLLRPGGSLLVTLREGDGDALRPTLPTSVGEVEALAVAHGLAIVCATTSHDCLGHAHPRWTSLLLRLSDDGVGALPLLRGIVHDHDKSSTYKLALLRAVARVADATPSLPRPRADEDVVDVSLGIVALKWTRMYLPLVDAEPPQMPGNAGPNGLTFARRASGRCSRRA